MPAAPPSSARSANRTKASRITRRRALVLFASVASAPMIASPASASQRAHWHGTAMGGDASLILDGFSDAGAADLIAAATTELARLEQIFSLFKPGSDISQLNETGILSPVPSELADALTLAADLNQKSNGAFDPTVQALWQAHARNAQDAVPSTSSLEAAQKRVGFHHIHRTTDQISLTGGANVTLNGIAQGIITDRIASLFRSAGAHHTLINLGEFRANGPRQDGSPWQVGLRNPLSVWKLDEKVPLMEGALATSAGSGHPLAGGHHLFDPQSGTSPCYYSSVTVFAPTAALADGLSTTLYVLPLEEAFGMVDMYEGVSARFTLANGQVIATPGWKTTVA